MDGYGSLQGRLLGGRYRVVRQLGEGGMGAVYEAIQENLGRRVAVKVLAAELCGDPAFLERFRREAEAAGRLMSPHVVQVNDFIQVPGEPVFLVMELLEGESLLDLLRRERLSPGRACHITVQLLSALGAAHAKGIVHRDLKPANIFLVPLAGGGELVKLLDFGIAILAEGQENDRLTRPGVMIGTPRYAAPEQIMARSMVDARTDLYAVGVLLYGMLAGRPPFTSTGAQLLVDIQEREPPDLHVVDPTVPPALVAVVQRAMRKHREERFQSAAEMVAALTPLSSSSPSRPPSAPPLAVIGSAAPGSAVLGSDVIGSDAPGSAVLGSDVLGSDVTAAASPRASRPSAPAAHASTGPSAPSAGGYAGLDIPSTAAGRSSSAPREPAQVAADAGWAHAPPTQAMLLPEPSGALHVPHGPAGPHFGATSSDPRLSRPSAEPRASSASSPARSGGSRATVGLVLGVLGVLALIGGLLAMLGLAVFLVSGGGSSPERPLAPVPRPSTVLDGTSLMAWRVDRAGLRGAGVVWAGELLGASSEYGSRQNAARQVLGAPDVYPSHGDDGAAWCPRGRDAGPEHVEVRFAVPVMTSAVVIVETLNPGALVRVDDLTDAQAPAVLWEGVAGSSSEARVLSVELPAPRAIRAVRLVLDTSRVPGWNEIDAIGLVPARPADSGGAAGAGSEGLDVPPAAQ